LCFSCILAGDIRTHTNADERFAGQEAIFEPL